MDETPYVVYHPLGSESLIEGGVGVSAKQQRQAFDYADIRWTDDPTEQYDLVHLNFPGPRAVKTLRDARSEDIPVIVHAHSLGDNIAHTYRFSNALAPIFRRYLTWFFRRADAVIAVSNATQRRLEERGITNTYVVSNGIDTGNLDGFDDLAIESSESTVVNLAQVYNIKGVRDFVETAETFREAKFKWFGHKHPLLAPRSTKKLIREAPPHVEFPGFVDDKRRAFAIADVFFFPSHRETQGISVLEAAYCRCPLVVRDIPALEWLEDGRHCIKANTVEGFSQAIQRLLESEALRDRLQNNARKLAKDHALDKVGKNLREVYDDVY
ncbi:MAG: glycosyltransferase family 4 protein [Halobacteriaceae archaeon]